MLLERVLLRLIMRQSRREEKGLVNPNERRATRSGALSGATRSAGSVFPPPALAVACVAMIHGAPSALSGEKMAAGKTRSNSMNRP